MGTELALALAGAHHDAPDGGKGRRGGVRRIGVSGVRRNEPLRRIDVSGVRRTRRPRPRARPTRHPSQRRQRLQEELVVLDGDEAAHDPHGELVVGQAELPAGLCPHPGPVHGLEGGQVQTQRHHREAGAGRHVQLVGHLPGLDLGQDDQATRPPGELALDLQEDPGPGGREVAATQDVAVVGVDPDGHAGQERRQTAQRPGLGGVGVDHRGPLPAEPAPEAPEGRQVGQGPDRPVEARQERDGHAPLPGVVRHVPLVLGDLAGQETGAPGPPVVHGAGQVHHVHGRSAHVQAGDDAVDEDGRGGLGPHAVAITRRWCSTVSSMISSSVLRGLQPMSSRIRVMSGWRRRMSSKPSP